LFVAHFFPFLSLDIGGRGNQIVLINSAEALYEFGNPWLAFFVAVFVVGAPVALVVGILYVLLPLFWDRALPGAVAVCRWVYDAGPWNMIEIFMLGILVSLMKLTKMATVHLGISFWAFALLIVCVTASFGAIDRTELWARLEEAKKLR
jgi:paraquat-inducible protein A